MPELSVVIIGANGQLGKALQQRYPEATAVDSDQLDITDTSAVANFEWSGVDAIINAAAYTNVDGAESPDGRVAAWQVNAVGAKNLAAVAQQQNITLVHISTDYVFDGTNDNHSEDEPFSPLSVYGASKAAGDLLVSTLPNHYILRTSWVIGDGKNFVRTMLDLAQKGINPGVVSDQIGRLTFTDTLVEAISHLLNSNSPFGTYNITNDGTPASWADIARATFAVANLQNTVTDITTDAYYKGKTSIAPRPLQSTLDLSKIQDAGFRPADWRESLKLYLKDFVL